jgi:hypothetical protein
MGEYANIPGPDFVAFVRLRSILLQSRSLARQFEQEAQSRAIQSCTDLEELRGVAMSLLKGAPGRGGQLI